MKIKKFLDHLSKLDNVRQWEERDSIIKESVSQHSFKVSAVCHYFLLKVQDELTRIGKIDNEKFQLFRANCLSYAILHDFDEAIIGRDISHVVKYNPYNGDKIREAINDFVKHQEQIDFNGVLITPDEMEKSFVKMCDWIALRTFCKRNKDLGCNSFDRELEYCNERLRFSVDRVVYLFDEYAHCNIRELIEKIIY